MIDRDMTALCAMQSIIADPSVLDCEDITCPRCNGTLKVGAANEIKLRCPDCYNSKEPGTIKATCARSVAIKAVRYADELIAELERTSKT